MICGVDGFRTGSLEFNGICVGRKLFESSLFCEGALGRDEKYLVRWSWYDLNFDDGITFGVSFGLGFSTGLVFGWISVPLALVSVRKGLTG